MRALNESLECLIESTDMISPHGETWEQLAVAIESDQSPMMGLAPQNDRRQATGTKLQPIKLGFLATACGFVIAMLTLQATLGRFLEPSVVHNEQTSSGLSGSIPKRSDWAVESAFEDQDENFPQLVSFHEPNQSRHVAGGMVVDIDGAQIHVHVQMKESRGYTLWFVTKDDRWVVGGPLKRLVGDHYGNVLDIPATEQPIVYAAITIGQVDDANSTGRDIALVSESVGDLSHRAL
ncbi:hypothetical protein [Allorhodopirellula solitaria]|nr:hypothetical protein [Allorhodopirellula solitaria]